MNIWHDMAPERINPDNFYAVVEIQKGSKTKYELDKETGMLVLDRILSTSTHYPANYGFIPLTLGDDDDPLDVLILCSEPIAPMTLVRCYPIGVFTMIDNGRKDSKIIAIPFSDPSYNGYTDVSDLPKHTFIEMTHFFSVYKELEEVETEVADVKGRASAIQTIQREIEHYRAALAESGTLKRKAAPAQE